MNPLKVSEPTQRWRVGYASGAFDLFHMGHLRYLQAAAEQCERLIVGVPCDAIVTRIKARAPVHTQVQRLEVVAALACVDQALAVEISMDDADLFTNFVVDLGVDALFIGADWAGTPRWERLCSQLGGRGINVVFMPRTEGISSTQLRKKGLKKEAYTPT
ncbi:MAG: adenylyltransferase/cytidyltransferase family protein [Gammaproteobacteria bacterium]|nr:adenylyltransferase/cytidyltransferase family protein [Gammaproteobacteria bacterium]MCP5198016.1 adenylyltransferase/cytidyltransferase family protein [Gammaproteobacteria bacterium]